MNVFELMRKFLATLLLAFVVGAMVSACSTTDEQEDSSEGTCEQSEREWPECLPI